MLKKAIWVTCFVAMIFPVSLRAAEVSPVEKSLYDLEFIKLRIIAVEQDMYYQIGWSPRSEDHSWKGAAALALSDLKSINTEIERLDLSQDIRGYRDGLLALVDSLQKLYVDIEDKTDEAIRDGYKGYQSAGEKLQEAMKVIGKLYQLTPTLPEFSVLDEEASNILDPKDKQAFLRAQSLIDYKKFSQAHALLTELGAKYVNTAVEASILTRLALCYEYDATDVVGQTIDEKEAFVDSLKGFINKSIYSPNLYHLFHVWRTMEQMHHNGASNMSVIPYADYIETRRRVVQTLIQQVQKTPADDWAEAQIIYLIALPLIQRGGPMGNTNLNHWAYLFSPVEEPTEPSDSLV